jgi:uncharacterized protein
MIAGSHLAAEWPATLDVAAQAATGWRPVPFRQFVLKLHGRCDLACDYCYMFAMADQGWREMPRAMPAQVVEVAADRIAAHATRHRLRSIEVVLHGGEPLLAGTEAVAHVATTLRRKVSPSVRLDLRVQTNGTRLDDRTLATLAAHHIRVGVSLDGDARGHDRHRRYAGGQGSFAKVRAGLARLTSHHPELFSGLLCTIDLRNDPVATYEALLEFAPPAVDLLLPHGNWSEPPPDRRTDDPTTPYGDWLVAVFDRWYPPAPRETSVRFFDEIIQLLLGGASRVEVIGLSPVAVMIIGTDGSFELADTLRSAYTGATATGLHVLTDELDAALTHPGVVARQIGRAALADTCRACPVHRICGGGYYPHRYRQGSGFRNPSVYCADLFRLIGHIGSRVREDLAAIASRRC